MDRFHKNGENTDGEETMFFRTPENGKTTDQFDTRQLNAAQVRRQAQNRYLENEEYPNNGSYPSDGASQPRSVQGGYPRNGYVQNGYSQNGHPQSNYAQNRSAQPYSSQGGYAQDRPSQSRPVQGSYPQNGRAPQSRTTYSRPQQQPRRPASSSSSGGYTRASAPRREQSYSRPQQPQNRSPQNRPSQSSAPPRHPASQPAPQQKRSAPRRRKQHSLLGRVLKLVLTIVVIVFLLYSVVAMIGILQMNRVETGDRGVTTGSLEESYVKNVLVIGTDTRDPEVERGRSDSMILVSLNSKTKEITMTSFMRDAYVSIPGNGSGKLNAAYSYGGPELLMDTLESNYDVRIDDYVMITFAACAGMIDAVGGVELTISDDEAQAVNEILISEVNEIMGDEREDDLLDSGGTLTLDGKQALSYSRIRYVGNADFERTERQRTVMQQVMEKASHNPLRLASICMTALPKMMTNLSVGSLYGYAVTTPFKLLSYDIAQQRIPADGTFSGATINGESVLEVDFAAAKQQLKDTVFASD